MGVERCPKPGSTSSISLRESGKLNFGYKKQRNHRRFCPTLSLWSCGPQMPGDKKKTLSMPHRDENQPSESQMGLGVPQQGLEPPAQPSPPALTQPHRVFGVLMHIPPCSTTSLSPPAVAVPVLGSDIRHDVLVEELQDQRDAVGKHQMLGHVLKLGERSETGQR